MVMFHGYVKSPGRTLQRSSHFFPPNWVKKQQQRQRQDNDNDNDNNNKLQSRHGWMVPVSEVEVDDRFK